MQALNWYQKTENALELTPALNAGVEATNNSLKDWRKDDPWIELSSKYYPSSV